MSWLNDSPTAEGPRYIKGHAITLSLVGFAGIIYSFLWWYFRRLNEQRDVSEGDDEAQRMSTDEMMELGDESPRYRYTV